MSFEKNLTVSNLYSFQNKEQFPNVTCLLLMTIETLDRTRSHSAPRNGEFGFHSWFRSERMLNLIHILF